MQIEILNILNQNLLLKIKIVVCWIEIAKNNNIIDFCYI